MCKVAVIAAHPGDEVLGCGGTIAKHVQQGDEVFVLILTEGQTNRTAPMNIAVMSQLRDAAIVANNILGVTDIFLESFPNNMMDSMPRIKVVQAIESFLKQCEPDIIYTHHSGDLSLDNRYVHDAVIHATFPMQGQNSTILFFEVQGSTELAPPGTYPAFMPNWFVNVQSTLETKIEALKAYDLTQPWPHPRSLEAITTLSMWRGSNCGYEAAEAFMLGRQIIH